MKTIRGKLTFYFTLVFGIMICLFSIILYTVFEDQNRTEIDNAMLVLAKSLSEEIRNDNELSDIENELKESYIPYVSPGQQVIEIFNSSGNIIYTSGQKKLKLNHEIPVESLKGTITFKTSCEKTGIEVWDKSDKRIMYYPVANSSENIFIVITVSLINIENILFRFRLILFIAIPLTLILSSVTGYLFSKKAYVPVNELIKNSNSITASNLEKRLPVNDSGDEISELAKTLNSMIERLQKSFLVLKQFTSDASHELRTPLTILKGEIEVTLNKERTLPEYQKILVNNLEEVERLQKIVDGLLTLSQLESNKNTIEFKKINLNEVLTEAVTKVNNLALQKKIKMLIKLYDRSGEVINSINVMGDYSLLSNVFINLLHNSIKFSHIESEITCTEELDEINSNVIVTVKDNGIGILPENSEKIFDRFYREDYSRTSGNNNASGLGLSISMSVIKAHHGNISVSSIPGEGAAFSVTLPYIT